jgi:hypothetical protein
VPTAFWGLIDLEFLGVLSSPERPRGEISYNKNKTRAPFRDDLISKVASIENATRILSILEPTSSIEIYRSNHSKWSDLWTITLLTSLKLVLMALAFLPLDV